MTYPETIGSIGVGLLLAAFAANLFGWLARSSRIYQGVNALGGGLACYASYLIGFFPFVLLEGTWAVAAAVALVLPRSTGRGRA